MQIEKTKRDIKLFHADYITDQEGKIKSVILDYKTYRKIEELLLDYGLVKAMEETLEDEELDIESAKKIVGF
jgi:hypothetical protein